MRAPRKSEYQTFSRPMRAGTFDSRGIEPKCSSTACIPASSSAKASGPIASTSEVPIAESME